MDGSWPSRRRQRWSGALAVRPSFINRRFSGSLCYRTRNCTMVLRLCRTLPRDDLSLFQAQFFDDEKEANHQKNRGRTRATHPS